MRARNENDVMSVHAIAGTHVVLLGLDVKGYAPPKPESSTELLSVALSRMALGSDEVHNGENKRAPAAATTTPRAASSSIEVKNPGRVVFVGFAIDRKDVSTKQSVSLNFEGRPIQKFHFGDYAVLPGKQYEYTVRRMIKAKSSFVSSSNVFVPYGSPVVVKVATEDPTKGTHGIYFNRGVAGSQAYSKRFGEYRKYQLVKKFGYTVWKSIINPRSIPDAKKSKEALAWLSRGLEEALLQFISQATGKEYRLLAAVYEFTHEETIQAFAEAVERGVDVKIVRHCKGSYHARVKRNELVKDESGNQVRDWIPDDVTDAATKAIESAGFRELKHAHSWQHDTFIERRHSSGIMHNKFIILVHNGKPVQVWTGSTNPTDGGIYGQSNVGHIVRDGGVASQYLEYWEHLSLDLPGRKHSSKTKEDSGHEDEKDPMDELNEQQQPDLEGQETSPSIKVIFSPRKTTGMLQWYADRMGDATNSVHYTAAFGVAQPLAETLNQDKGRSKPRPVEGLRRSPRIARRCKGDGVSDTLLRYILLDNKPSEQSSKKKREDAQKKSREYIDYYDFKDIPENRVAFGAVLPANAVAADASEESLTGFTHFVDYVHTKCMIVDALTDDPLVITGSANFSEASTDKNDENSLVIRDTMVADIYLTEFMRLFDHFFARDKYNKFTTGKSSKKSGRSWGKVVMDESWLRPYFDPSSQLYRERMLLR